MHVNDIMNAQLLEATRLTNAGRLTEATAALQRMLGNTHAVPDAAASPKPMAQRQQPTLDGVAEPYEPTQGGTHPGPQRRQPVPAPTGRPCIR